MANDSDSKKPVQLNADIPKDLKEKLDAAVKTKGLKRKWVVEQLIRKWLAGEINLKAD